MPLNRRELLQQGTLLAMSSSLPLNDALAADTKAATAPKVDPYRDAIFVDGPPPLPAKDSFTVVVLPDTQHYSEKFPDRFFAQTNWIAAQIESRRIAAVLHLGDITNRNSAPEWEVAKGALGKLDGRVPYFMTLGNHDYGDRGGCADRTTQFNDFFPLEKYRAKPEFGGVYDREPERLENNYHLFSAGGRNFLVLSLEFGPRADVIRWANEVVAKHRDREAILITHAYMYYDETRYDWKQRGKDQRWNPHSYKVAAATNDDVHDGEELWVQLVSKHENFICTFNGHVLDDGLGRLTTATPGGRNVHQLLVNFQMKPNGGDGWLRLLEFKADRRTVVVRDYSPVLDRQNESPQNRFDLELAAVKT